MNKKTIDVKENILSENDKLAMKNRNILDKNKVFSINIMASPGAGKTTLIDKTIEKLKSKYKIGVIDGDVVDVDLKKLSHHNTSLSLANTGGACHLDAVMVSKSLADLPLESIDLLIVENVGNLICPSHFSLGTHMNLVIASVPEGDDKPYKYPNMFLSTDVLILNKSDYLKYEDFDTSYFREGVDRLNKDYEFFQISCKNGDGIDKWINWLDKKLK